MRARLLDMGEVSAVRSQSFCHAVAATMRPDADPAFVLLSPASACVSIGDAETAEVDLDFCRARGLPVVRRHGSGGALLPDANQLLWSVVLPAARAADLGLPPRPEEAFEALARVPVAAYRSLGVGASFRAPSEIEVKGRKIGTLLIAEIGDGLFLAGSMVYDFDAELIEQALRQDAGALTCLRRELAEPPGVEAIAEALFAAVESHLGLEPIPSMPTPDEMDAIYEWDERLIADHASSNRFHQVTA